MKPDSSETQDKHSSKNKAEMLLGKLLIPAFWASTILLHDGYKLPWILVISDPLIILLPLENWMVCFSHHNSWGSSNPHGNLLLQFTFIPPSPGTGSLCQYNAESHWGVRPIFLVRILTFVKPTNTCCLYTVVASELAMREAWNLVTC